MSSEYIQDEWADPLTGRGHFSSRGLSDRISLFIWYAMFCTSSKMTTVRHSEADLEITLPEVLHAGSKEGARFQKERVLLFRYQQFNKLKYMTL